MRKNADSGKEAAGSYLTTGDVARKHHTSSEQVRRWIHDGDLVAIRRKNFIRIKPEALEEFERRFTIGKSDAIAMPHRQDGRESDVLGSKAERA